MKISDVETFVVATPPPHLGGRVWIFVKLTTDNGLVGYGEVYQVPFHPLTVATMIEDLAATYAVGEDPFQIERLFRHAYYGEGYESKIVHQHPDHSVLAIISALEMACWDILGKAMNQPIYNLMGGKYHERLRSYSYLYAAPDDKARGWLHCDPERAARGAAAMVKDGFTAVKFDPLLDVMSVKDPQETPLDRLDNAEAVVRAVREAVGGSCDILIGTHGQTPTSSALRFAKRVEQYDPLWFEEPVPPENIDEMARVAQHTSIPVATGERLAGRFEFRQLLEAQAAAILQPALGRVGGIFEAKKIASMAEAYYAQIAPHLYCGPIEEAANIQLDVCSPNFLIQESIGRLDGFHADLLTKPLKWEDGYIIPPTEPGLGVELDEKVARAHAYRSE